MEILTKVRKNDALTNAKWKHEFNILLCAWYLICLFVLFCWIGLPSSLVEAEERRRKSSESSMSGGKSIELCFVFSINHGWIILMSACDYFAILKINRLFQVTPQREVLRPHQRWVHPEVEILHHLGVECCLPQAALFLEEISFIKGLKVWCNK